MNFMVTFTSIIIITINALNIKFGPKAVNIDSDTPIDILPIFTFLIDTLTSFRLLH